MKSSSPKPRLIQWSKSLVRQQARKSKHVLPQKRKCSELSMYKVLPIRHEGMLEESEIGDTKQQSEAIWMPMKRKIVLNFYVILKANGFGHLLVAWKINQLMVTSKSTSDGQVIRRNHKFSNLVSITE